MFTWKWCRDDVENRFRFEYKLCFVIDKDILPLLPKFIASIGYDFFYPWYSAARASRARGSAINYFLHILIFNNPWIHHFHIDHNALFLRPLPPPSICIIILSNFFKVLRSYQEKSKTMVMQNFGGKQSARIQYFPMFQFSSIPIFDQNRP